MPINAGPEFFRAKEEYEKASSTGERLAALKRMLATAPKHKGSEKLLAQLKKKLSALKKESAKEKKAGKKRGIKKEGAATIAFIGVLNSGKSRLFARLTNSAYEGENNYEVKMRMIPYENVWLQGLDMPAFYAGFSKSGSARQVFGTIRAADVLVLVANEESELKLLQKELAKIINEIPVLAVFPDAKPEDVKRKLWQKCDKIRVQTKTKAGVAQKPVVLKRGAVVRDLAASVHQDFVKNFKYAKVWGPSARFPGQVVGLEHKLKDRDVVEVFVK